MIPAKQCIQYASGNSCFFGVPTMICGVAGFHASLALADTAVKVHHRVAKALNRNRTP